MDIQTKHEQRKHKVSQTKRGYQINGNLFFVIKLQGE